MEKQRVVATLNKVVKTCLEGHGFKKIKCRKIQFIRVIDGKIVQGIECFYEPPFLLEGIEKGIAFYCGMTTIYDRFFDYSELNGLEFNKAIRYQEPLYFPTYYTFKQDTSESFREAYSCWNRIPSNNVIISDLDGTVENVLNAINNKIMPIYDRVKTLKDYVDFYEKFYKYDLYTFFINESSSGIPVLMEKYPNLWDYMDKLSDEEYKKLKASLCEEANGYIERKKEQLEIISEKLSDEEYEKLKKTVLERKKCYPERVKKELEKFLKKRRKAINRIEDITRPGSTELQKEIELNQEKAKRNIESLRKAGIEI